jgi:hypothetical protein
MSLVASANSASSFEICPEGVHIGRCNRIIDLGTQSWEFKGAPKSGRKIIIGWETPTVTTVEGKAHTLINKYTLSLGENATLRKDLQSWRGRAFTPVELEGFELTNLLNAPCMLNVVHQKKGEKTYANISSIIPLPGGMVAPQLTSKPFIFSLSDFNAEVFEGLADYFKNQIMASPEYAAIVNGTVAPHDNFATGGKVQDGDIPFDNPYRGKYSYVV